MKLHHGTHNIINCGQAYVAAPILLEHTASASLPYRGVCALLEKQHRALL